MNPARQEPRGPIDKRAARRAFERAAASYDGAAVLQREIAARLLERLDYVRLIPERVLDLGCGTGGALEDLARRYRRAHLMALDFALPMLRRARARGRWWRRPRALCADIDALPLAAESIDLVFSNATLQWSNDLDACLADLRRIVRPGGLLMFTTFGPDTLIELRRAWAAVDDEAHVSPFLDMHDIGDALVRARFADPVMDVERLTLTYASARDLMRDIKAIGARNPLTTRRRGITGRHRLAAMERAYETLRGTDGRLPSTWEVVYGQAWVSAIAPAPPRRHARADVVIPVAAIGRRRAP